MADQSTLDQFLTSLRNGGMESWFDPDYRGMKDGLKVYAKPLTGERANLKSQWSFGPYAGSGMGGPVTGVGEGQDYWVVDGDGNYTKHTTKQDNVNFFKDILLPAAAGTGLVYGPALGAASLAYPAATAATGGATAAAAEQGIQNVAPLVAGGAETGAVGLTAQQLTDPVLGQGSLLLGGTGAAGVEGGAGVGLSDILKDVLGVANVKDAVNLLTQGTVLAGTIGAIAGGGDKTVSGTTSNVPSYIQERGKKTWDEYIDDFYGVGQNAKSIQARGAEDVAAQKGYERDLLDKLGALDASHLADTRAGVAPYQSQLANVLNQSQTGTGYFKPVNLSFGGNPIASFVPRQNRQLAEQSLGMGKEASSINTALADLGYGQGKDLASREFQFNAAHPANEAATNYTAKLTDLMKMTNFGTETTTGTVPGVPWYSQLLQGINTGVDIWSKINTQRSGNNELGEIIARSLINQKGGM